MAKRKTKIPVKALGIGAAVLVALGLFAGGEEEASPEPTATAEPVRAATVKPLPTVVPTDTPKPTATPYLIHRLDPQTEVYVSKQGVIHFDNTCSGMKHYTAMTLEKADAAGYEYCTRCAW